MRGKWEGASGISRRGLGRRGGLQREAGGGGLRGCARVFAPAYWQEEDDERGGKWAGPASYSAGPPVWTGKRQVVSALFFISVLFFFYLILLPLF